MTKLEFEIDVILDKYQTEFHQNYYQHKFEIDVILDKYQTNDKGFC